MWYICCIIKYARLTQRFRSESFFVNNDIISLNSNSTKSSPILTVQHSGTHFPAFVKIEIIGRLIIMSYFHSFVNGISNYTGTIGWKSSYLLVRFVSIIKIVQIYRFCGSQFTAIGSPKCTIVVSVTVFVH